MTARVYLRIIGRKLWQATALLLLAICFTTPASAQGSNGVADATCAPNPTLTLNFSPGLTLFTRQTSLTGSTPILDCVFLTGDGLTHTANLVSLNGGGNLSCLVTPNANGTLEFAYDDGTTSQITWNTLQVGNLSVPTVPRVFIISGTVTGGKFAGDSFVIQYNDIPDLQYLDCLSTGLTQIQGTASITFTHLNSL